MSTLAERLRAARSVFKLKQKEMAAQSGVSDRSYQGYEDGRSVPGGEAIEGFVRLGINANWLLTGEGAMLLSDIKPQSTSGAFDSARFKLAIETVEEGLTATQTTMAAAKKAELVLAVYELLEEPGVSKERVLKLVKFAA